jgi:ABC-type branched-subunit amino acid transport system ATPase component
MAAQPPTICARLQSTPICLMARSDRAAPVIGLGAAGLKKLELAKALTTGPSLLLADESLGGLDEAEMDQAAENPSPCGLDMC